MKRQSLIFQLHRLSGLVVGLILLVIGLTGSAIVFWEPLERELHPELYRPSEQITASFDRVVATARAYYPTTAPKSVIRRDGNVYVVCFVTPDHKLLQVFVDPQTFAVRGSRYWEETLFGVLHQLHSQLLLGRAGEQIAGIAAFMLVVLGSTGVLLWPGWKKWKAGISVRWGANKRLLSYDLHKLTGMLASVFLTILGFTGVYLIFQEPLKGAVYALTGTPQPTELISTSAPGLPALTLDGALAHAQGRLAGAEVQTILLPTKPSAVYEVRGQFPTEGAVTRTIRVSLDQYSGRILRIQDARKPNTAELFLNWMSPLHSGTFGGIFSQVMYVFVGLAPGGLFLTGFTLWLSKQHRAGSKVQSRQPVSTRY